MGRQLRIEYPNAHYHVTARGNERKDIFRNDRDREKFLSYLESAVVRYGAVIHAWCLMSNHYHLLVQTPEGNLSKVMHHLNGAYTNYFNVKRRRSGHLLQGRYKAILIAADEYALELSRYIHMNPVRVGIAPSPSEYRWSSCQDYTEKRTPPLWLTRDFILGFFGQSATAASEQYLRFVDEMLGKEYKNPLKDALGATILGSPSFVDRIQVQYIDSRINDRNLLAKRDLCHGSLKPTIEQVIQAAQEVFGDQKRLAKKMVLHLCHRYSGLNLREIGARFGIKDSGVSQASRRFAAEIEADHNLQKIVFSLRQKLNL